MSLFTGQAWFSPRVPSAVRKAWAAHGGVIAGAHGERMSATYLFCDGNDDPWFPKLYQRSMAVFHWLWVPAVVNARFRVPISAYAIDEKSVMEAHEHPVPAYSRGPARPVDVARQEEVSDDYSILTDHSSVSRARPRLTAVRILGEEDTGIEEHAGRSHHKREAVPFVDLRFVNETRKPSKDKRARHIRVAVCAPDKSRRETLGQTEGLPKPVGVLVSGSVSTPRRPHQAISVSAALESLSFVSIEDATQFTPGVLYQGKEFRCFYVR